jgi:phosphopantetheinyl transferase
MMENTQFKGKCKADWRYHPQRPALGANVVHIWRADLNSLPAWRDCAGLLADAELARAEKLVVPEKRHVFAASRAVLRLTLAGYCSCDAHDLRFHTLPGGKPVLDDPCSSRILRFNLSHAGRWMLLAVSADHEVGIDLEPFKPVMHKAWALANLFTESERQQLVRVPAGRQERAFVRVWTKKEAVLKALGCGLQGARIRLAADLKQTRKTPLWFTRFAPAPGYTAALAALGTGEPILRFWDFYPAKWPGLTGAIPTLIYEQPAGVSAG